MAERSAKGNCYLCGRLLAKSAFRKHVLTAHPYEGEDGQDCVVLKVEDTETKEYWLYLDVAVTSSLRTLDTFLRNIWLECCGHMSAFFDSGYTEMGMGRKIISFPVGSSLLYEYDFGSTTQLKITIVGYSRRPKQQKAVRLLGRNAPYHFSCSVCGKEAAYLCCECQWTQDNPFLCEDCAREHEHGSMLPVVNSPRMGVCAYCGEMDIYEFEPDKTDWASR